jgi:D-galacturonate reductase
LSHHQDLIALAKENGVVCMVEHHKRLPCFLLVVLAVIDCYYFNSFDPVYSDAKARAATLGEFNFFNAWMSQPKSQLETFRAWAGKDSDIRLEKLVV